LTESRQFKVRIRNFEPLSLGDTKGQKYRRKAKLLARIEEEFESKPNELQEFKEAYQNKLVKVSVVFYLWEGSPNVSDTRFKKDLDNLVKPVLDVLQVSVDAGGTARGLGLILNDNYVSVLHIAKELVAGDKEEGVEIIVSEHRDDGMLRRLKGDLGTDMKT